MNFQRSDREAQRQPRVVGKIDQLFIYPLKSAEGIPISSGYAAEQSWIQKYLTQYPKLYSYCISNDRLEISSQNPSKGI